MGRLIENGIAKGETQGGIQCDTGSCRQIGTKVITVPPDYLIWSFLWRNSDALPTLYRTHGFGSSSPWVPRLAMPIVVRLFVISVRTSSVWSRNTSTTLGPLKPMVRSWFVFQIRGYSWVPLFGICDDLIEYALPSALVTAAEMRTSWRHQKGQYGELRLIRWYGCLSTIGPADNWGLYVVRM